MLFSRRNVKADIRGGGREPEFLSNVNSYQLWKIRTTQATQELFIVALSCLCCKCLKSTSHRRKNMPCYFCLININSTYTLHIWFAFLLNYLPADKAVTSERRCCLSFASFTTSPKLHNFSFISRSTDPPMSPWIFLAFFFHLESNA